jgi:hypothetical protein
MVILVLLVAVFPLCDDHLPECDCFIIKTDRALSTSRVQRPNKERTSWPEL